MDHREREQGNTRPLDFPIAGGDGVAPGIDLSSNAALADFVDEADTVYERFRVGPVTPDGAARPRSKRTRS